ncbi:MAG: DUF3048 domain-containing protein [Chloroflexi bacterium]|nr:DUF3048 domain-containing protein [Chloroflexota bacterium]
MLLALALLTVLGSNSPAYASHSGAVAPSTAGHIAIGRVGPAKTRAADVTNPFTGLSIDAAAANRRPLLVKVANTSNVRPQDGLADADIVLEHYSEGGITRFTALFLTHSPEKVGSVRSCRLIDLELPVIFGAGVVCSGTSAGVRQRLFKSKSWEGSKGSVKNTVWMVSDLGRFECLKQAGCTLPMFRTPDRRAPHNLFANTLNAWNELQARGLNQPTSFNSWSFGGGVPETATATQAITIPYTSGAVRWAFDASAGKWTRFVSSRPHTDKATGAPLMAANILVVYANHVATNIIEDSGGSRSIEIQLWEQGRLQVFRDGRMIEGTWKRAANGGGLELVDAGGAAIVLKPGNSWLELVPLKLAVKTS